MNKKQTTSNELIQAMLDQQLEANEIKLVLAYVSLGGWKEGQEAFLPESVITQYGMNKSTIKRHRKSLIAKGWMQPTGKKSKWGVDMYLISIPAEVAQIDLPRGSNLSPRVVQNEPQGGPLWSTEVIKEVTKGSNEVSNKETVPTVATAPEVPVLSPSPDKSKEEPVLPNEGTSLCSNDSGRNLAGGTPANGGPIREQLTNKEEREMATEQPAGMNRLKHARKMECRNQRTAEMLDVAESLLNDPAYRPDRDENARFAWAKMDAQSMRRDAQKAAERLVGAAA